MRTRPHCNGFSVIEIVITLAVAGVLAAIALPLYRDYQASAELTDTIGKLEAFSREVNLYYQLEGELPKFDDIGLTSVANSYEVVFGESSDIWNLVLYYTTFNQQRAVLVIHSRSPHRYDKKLWQLGIQFRTTNNMFEARCAANAAAEPAVPATCTNSFNTWNW